MAYEYTYLGLVNEVLNELNEVELTDEMDFNKTQGFHTFVKNKINSAIYDVSTWHNLRWPFLWTQQSLVLTPGTMLYNAKTDVNASILAIDWNSFYIDYDPLILDSPESRKLEKMDMDNFFRYYFVNEVNSTDSLGWGKPNFVTQSNDNISFYIHGKAGNAYTVKFQAYVTPLPLVEYDDVPVIPEAFRTTIVQRAMYYAYMFRDNFESADRAKLEFKDSVNNMRMVLIPYPEAIKGI